MQCKNHSSRKAEHFCDSCGIPLCNECAEETTAGEHYCFQCAMLKSVSDVGTSLTDKRQKSAEKKQSVKEKKKWGPFNYFMISSSVVIIVMWGVILFGGEKKPADAADISNNPRAFLFMADASVKRFAHYEGNKYPENLEEMIPRYLAISKENKDLLNLLKYQKDSQKGYRLSLAHTAPGEMEIIMTEKGIEHVLPSGGGI